MNFNFVLDHFCESFSNCCSDILGIDLEIKSKKYKEIPKFTSNYDCFAMLDFRGSALGFLACACSEKTLAQLTGMNELSKAPDRHELRNEYGGVLTEILNTVSGEVVEDLRDELPIITILAPKIYFGSEVIYPEVLTYTLDIETNFGPMTFYINIDEMQQDILRLLEQVKSASRAKNHFLSTMSHEIRTPINGIVGMTDLLIDTNLDSEQQEYSQMIRESTNALLTIINDILDFTKFDNKEILLENINFDLYGALESCIDLLASVAYKKGLDILLLIDADVPQYIIGDPTRIRQIVQNFLSNAIKFTKEGDITLRVHLEERKEALCQLKFEVEDSGCGIPLKSREKLFDSFTQVDSSHTRKFGGTGLGLAICKKLVLAMGGNIGVDSEIDIGSNFWFTTNSKLSSDQQMNLKPLEDIIHKEIFLIDRHTNNETVFSHYFENYDVNLIRFENLHQAKQHIQKNKIIPDVLITHHDEIEPLSSLVETYKAFKEKHSSVRLIFLTDFGYKGDASLVKSAGFEAYFVKPIKVEYLKNCLQKFYDSNNNEDKNTLITTHSIKESLIPDLEILIVEDNKINQKMIAKIMKKLDIRYTLAEDGLKAVEAAKAKNYHIIFMDCLMPNLDGFEATKQIRNLEKELNKTKAVIIALTANKMKDGKAKSLECGMDDFLLKPMRSQTLSQVIKKYASN